MAYITGLVLIDAPASALNNSGKLEGSRTDNAIGVKKIRTREGDYPYVSAQSFRYWLRTVLEQNGSGWKSAPVHREGKIAYTEADPIDNWDDDLFGYMRAESKKADAGAASESLMPLEKDREITRVSPFRVSTLVSVAPSRIVEDFGTMTRHEGNPVPHEHQFYRAHLKGLFSMDLTSAGTFYDGERVGFKNLDKHRRDKAKQRSLQEVTVHKQKAIRLPLAERQARVAALMGAIGNLTGGAKLALHYTDVTPAIIIAAITKGGNHPFQRWITAGESHQTQLHAPSVVQTLEAYKTELLSPIFVGWAEGFLDEHRENLNDVLSKNLSEQQKYFIKHPKVAMDLLTEELSNAKNAKWYD